MKSRGERQNTPRVLLETEYLDCMNTLLLHRCVFIFEHERFSANMCCLTNCNRLLWKIAFSCRYMCRF